MSDQLDTQEGQVDHGQRTTVGREECCLYRNGGGKVQGWHRMLMMVDSQ
jgi:hypothetical protein